MYRSPVIIERIESCGRIKASRGWYNTSDLTPVFNMEQLKAGECWMWYREGVDKLEQLQECMGGINYNGSYEFYLYRAGTTQCSWKNPNGIPTITVEEFYRQNFGAKVDEFKSGDSVQASDTGKGGWSDCFYIGKNMKGLHVVETRIGTPYTYAFCRRPLPSPEPVQEHTHNVWVHDGVGITVEAGLDMPGWTLDHSFTPKTK